MPSEKSDCWIGGLFSDSLSEVLMEFLRILFFAKMVLLTPEPIDLHGSVELRPREPLIAITTGASIEVDVSSMITKNPQEGVVEFRRRVNTMLPLGAIEAKLLGSETRAVALRYDGSVAYSENQVMLSLTSDTGVPTGTEFTQVVVMSRVDLKSIKVSWRNYKK
jgi:hypothetical protein